VGGDRFATLQNGKRAIILISKQFVLNAKIGRMNNRNTFHNTDVRPIGGYFCPVSCTSLGCGTYGVENLIAVLLWSLRSSPSHCAR
jgi:hypothetical protein